MTSADSTGDAPRLRSAAPQPVADVDLPFEIGDLHALRSTLAAHASLVGAAEEQVEHLLIVASELANNAIRHGGGRGRLRLWYRGGWLYCQVSDEGPGIPDPTIGTERPDPRRTDGHRGLWICRNLAEELTIAAGPDGRGATVTAAIHGSDRSSV